MFFRMVWCKNLDRSFFPFCHNSRVWQTDGKTDRRTDRILIARPRLHSMQHGKKIMRYPLLDNIAICFFIYLVLSIGLRHLFLLWFWLRSVNAGVCDRPMTSDERWCRRHRRRRRRWWCHLAETTGRTIWHWPSRTATCWTIRSTATSGSRCCRQVALPEKNFRWLSAVIATCSCRAVPSSSRCWADRWPSLPSPAGLRHLRLRLHHNIGVSSNSRRGRRGTMKGRTTRRRLCAETFASPTSHQTLSGSCSGARPCLHNNAMFTLANVLDERVHSCKRNGRVFVEDLLAYKHRMMLYTLL